MSSCFHTSSSCSQIWDPLGEIKEFFFANKSYFTLMSVEMFQIFYFVLFVVTISFDLCNPVSLKRIESCFVVRSCCRGWWMYLCCEMPATLSTPLSLLRLIMKKVTVSCCEGNLGSGSDAVSEISEQSEEGRAVTMFQLWKATNIFTIGDFGFSDFWYLNYSCEWITTVQWMCWESLVCVFTRNWVTCYWGVAESGAASGGWCSTCVTMGETWPAGDTAHTAHIWWGRTREEETGTDILHSQNMVNCNWIKAK